MLIIRPISLKVSSVHVVVINSGRWQVSSCSKIEFYHLGFAGFQFQMTCSAKIVDVVSDGQ